MFYSRGFLLSRSTAPLLEATPSLRLLVPPLAHFLPHAALKKIFISNFLKPLKPVAVWRTDVSARRPAESEEKRGEDDDWSASVFAESKKRSAEGSEAEEEETESLVLIPQESLDVRNSKEFLIARLDELSASDLASRLS